MGKSTASIEGWRTRGSGITIRRQQPFSGGIAWQSAVCSTCVRTCGKANAPKHSRRDHPLCNLADIHCNNPNRGKKGRVVTACLPSYARLRQEQLPTSARVLDTEQSSLVATLLDELESQPKAHVMLVIAKNAVKTRGFFQSRRALLDTAASSIVGIFGSHKSLTGSMLNLSLL